MNELYNDWNDEKEAIYLSWVESNESRLMDLWDTYKFEHYSELFCYDDVDYFDEDLFDDMCARVYEDEVLLDDGLDIYSDDE